MRPRRTIRGSSRANAVMMRPFQTVAHRRLASDALATPSVPRSEPRVSLYIAVSLLPVLISSRRVWACRPRLHTLGAWRPNRRRRSPVVKQPSARTSPWQRSRRTSIPTHSCGIPATALHCSATNSRRALKARSSSMLATIVQTLPLSHCGGRSDRLRGLATNLLHDPPKRVPRESSSRAVRSPKGSCCQGPILDCPPRFPRLNQTVTAGRIMTAYRN